MSVLVLAIILITGCGRFKNKGNDVKGQRIVCVSKHLTEMLFALGKGSQIVAVDLSSTYPDSAKLLKTVGYHRVLSAEGIISMNPDLVIHSNDIGPETVVPQLEKVGMKIKVFPGANTLDSARLLLTQLGEYFDAKQQADSINKSIDAEMQKVAEAQKQYSDTPSVMIIHFGRANNVYFVMSGRNGAGDKMIAMAGGKSAKYDAKGAREISAEAVAAANPDVIIATDFGFDKMGGVEKFKTIPGVALTNAAKNNRIVRFEEHDLVYFGPRSGQNILQLMKLIHMQNAPAK